MINTTEAYRAAITGDVRRILLKAVIDISDPDLVYGAVTDDSAAPWSKPEQLHNKEFKASGEKYITLERGRWILGDAFKVIPVDNVLEGEIGAVNDALCDENCIFDPPAWVQQSFSNVSILQACSVFFSDKGIDGYPVDFTVEVLQGGTAYHTRTFTNNTARFVSLSGFTVYNPDAIKVTVTKWSLPRRRMRVIEILPGIYEEWDDSILAEFNIVQQASVSNTTVPYGTCTLRMDNFDRRFEPRNKGGIFKSIEERQGIKTFIGVRLPDDSDAYMPVGVYYQANNGWRTSDNNLGMQWNLVDIIGLLADRTYIVPNTLPTTLSGWIKSIVAHLGTNFENNYTVDPDYASLSATVTDAAALTGMRCGDVLRYVCMVTGTWARADNETGFLTVEPVWHQGNEQSLDNMTEYPVMKANNEIAQIVFNIDGTQFVVSGTSTAAARSENVANPFIHTQEQALTAAKMILATFGGNQLETVGRGDPSGEIGDVDTVQLDESNATTGRKVYQSFTIRDGVLQDCKTTLLQADGVFLYEGVEIITQSGTWTAPAGATKLRAIIVGGGLDGTAGTNGTWEEAGVDGIPGAGGKIWTGAFNINEQQKFEVYIANTGEDTTFGDYSSANGVRYTPAYTDVDSGNAYGRVGVAVPAANTGDGGAAGKGGIKGKKRQVTKTEYVTDPETNTTTSFVTTEIVIDNKPGKGTAGAKGASGCVVVYWDKEAT